MENEKIKLVDAASDFKEKPDPEIAEKKHRRKFTAKYKLDILDQIDKYTQPGQIGALLRREGLYSSSITSWRRQRDHGLLNSLSPQKRGRKNIEKNPLSYENARLQKENDRLKKKLKQAETIIAVQKKVSEILGISQDHTEGDDS